jgi:N4-gp56 family major capsid protein
MARTIIGVNDPKAVRKYSAFLAVDTAKTGYWNRKFMGVGEAASTPVQMLPHLENDAGDKIDFDLSVALKQEPIEGDDIQEGTEEQLKFYTDGLILDQMRGGVNSGGRMTRKRTIHNLRTIGRKRQAEWWSRVFDELFFMYGSGARGINPGFVFRSTYAGFAGNAFAAPDADHLVMPAATAKATLAATDKMTLAVIDKAKTYADVMGGETTELVQLQPIMINGEEHYVCVMHPWQEYDLRTATGEGKWLDIQKAAAQAEGKASPIFRGGLGMYNNVVLHSHKSVIRFNDYGAGGNVEAARALFLGEQHMVCAFGSPGTGLRFDWHEESRDNGNQLVISTSAIFGIKTTVFNSKWYGGMAIDTAAKAPV